jgi:hypothetical protein
MPSAPRPPETRGQETWEKTDVFSSPPLFLPDSRSNTQTEFHTVPATEPRTCPPIRTITQYVVNCIYNLISFRCHLVVVWESSHGWPSTPRRTTSCESTLAPGFLVPNPDRQLNSACSERLFPLAPVSPLFAALAKKKVRQKALLRTFGTHHCP